jgi:ABC-type bacteriocin/lantibiotic exporter with double-glycine peptidase domain
LLLRFVISMALHAGILSCIAHGREPDHAENLTSIASKGRSVCGLHCLYMVLKLHGLDVKFADVEKVTELRNSGISLYGLKQAASRLGVRARVIRCSLAELQKISLPVIAHLKEGPKETIGGHYVVITRFLDNQRIEYIDGTTGQIQTASFDRLRAYWWTGYVLELEQARDKKVWAWCTKIGVALLAVTASVVLAGVLGRRLIQRSESPSEWKRWFSGICLAVAALGLIHSIVTGAESSPTGPPRPKIETWRSPNSQYATCLYIELASTGRKLDYVSIYRELAGQHDSENRIGLVRKIAAKAGEELELLRLTFHELIDLEKPVIAIMDERFDVGQEMVVVARVGGKSCVVVRGTTATIEYLSLDEFRRTWSGYALVRSSTSRHSWLWWREFFFVGVAVHFVVRMPLIFRACARRYRISGK